MAEAWIAQGSREEMGKCRLWTTSKRVGRAQIGTSLRGRFRRIWLAEILSDHKKEVRHPPLYSGGWKSQGNQYTYNCY